MSLSFRPKQFLQPSDETELKDSLKRHSGRARIIAGGTGLYEIAHRGLLTDIEVLIDISKLGYSYVREEEGCAVIGSATVMSDLPEFVSRPSLGAIHDAISAIQPLQVKNVATVGGAVCTALPFLDLPVALLALQAKVKISPSGRTSELSDFLKGYFALDLVDGEEFVKEIIVPFSRFESSAFQKFALTHDDWALMNCAVALSFFERDGKSKPGIRTATIFFGGGLAEKPARASNCEQNLLEADHIDSAIAKKIFDESLSKDIEPVSDIRATSEFRTRIAKVLGLRTLIQAIERAQK